MVWRRGWRPLALIARVIIGSSRYLLAGADVSTPLQEQVYYLFWESAFLVWLQLVPVCGIGDLPTLALVVSSDEIHELIADPKHQAIAAAFMLNGLRGG